LLTGAAPCPGGLIWGNLSGVEAVVLLSTLLVASGGPVGSAPLLASTSGIHQQDDAGQNGGGRRLIALARARRLLEAGEAEEAEPLLKSLLAAAESSGDQSTASLVEGSLGRARGMAGDPRAAREWFDKAERRARAHRLVRPLGWTFLLRGNDAYVAGDLDAARTSWQQALTQFETSSDLEMQSFVLRGLSYVSGEAAADGLLSRALTLAEKSGSVGNRGLVLHTMSDVAYLRGQWSRAQALVDEALPLVLAHGTPIETVRVHLSQARLYRSHGRKDVAMKAYVSARERLSSIQRGIGVSQAWATLASGLYFLGAVSDATSAARRAVDVAALSGNAIDATVAAYVSSYVLVRSGDAAAALAAAEAVGRPEGGARRGLAVNRALALSALGRHAEALKVAAEAEQIEGSILEAIPEDLAGLAEVRRQAGDRALAVRNAREAVAVLERLRGNSLPFDRLKAGFDEGFAWVHGRLVRLLAETGQEVEALEASERARARAFADLLASRELNIATPSPVLKNVGRPSHLLAPIATATAIASQARQLNSAVVSYWIDGDGLMIWVVTPDGSTAHRAVKVSARQLSRLVERTWNAREAATGGSTAFRQLYDLLIKPIDGVLSSARTPRLTVVPHQSLFRLSFAALQGADGRYLIERFAIHYVPSMTAASALAASPASIDRTSLVVTSPELGADRMAREGLPSLPGARAEGAAVAQELDTPSANMLSGAGATDDAVRARIGRPGVLHFATHAVLSDAQPMDSYLALATSGKPGSDGRLTAEEVYGLSIDADLVVLSGCRTASGEITGDGVIGLSRAFFAAGAPAIVASLWDLPDVAGREILPAFYQAWRRSGDKAAALRDAQLALLKRLRSGRFTVDTPAGPIAVTPHPSVWAGLVLIGR
jgi:CHAT domain-containing protein